MSLKSRLDISEDRINEPGDRAIDLRTEIYEDKNNKKQNREESIREIWKIVKRFNVHVVKALEIGDREWDTGNIEEVTYELTKFDEWSQSVFSRNSANS